MKILMVIENDFPPDTRVENEIETLIMNNYEVHIASITRQNKAKVDFFNKAIIHKKKISSFTLKSSVGAMISPHYFNFWRKFINSLLKNGKFDVIHIHDLPLAKVGKEMAEKYNLFFVLDLHENWPALLQISSHTKTPLGRLLSYNFLWKKYEKKYCKKADKIIVVIEESKNRLVDLGISEKKIHIVSNTLNINHFKTYHAFNLDNNYFTILYSGGINKHRGLQVAIKGLTCLPQHVRMWITGTGSYVEKLKEYTKKLNINKRVSFLGWIPVTNMGAYFSEANAFLIPHLKSSHTDTTIPHKLFQYMYSQKPIIASNCTPIERIVKENQCGIIYKYDDPNDFCKKVKLLMNNKVIINTKNAHERVLKKYNWKNDAQELLRVYNY